MILVDVNLLLHAYNADFPDHSRARKWWEQTVNTGEEIGLAWVTILGFLRILTNPRAMPKPMPTERAVQTAEEWLSLPNVTLVNPGPRHPEILFRFIRNIGVAGNLTTDAHLAALCIEHQGRLASTDADFSRFGGLRWFNPLA